MIEFFRDILDGPLYIGITIISIIFIMAIIGFLMERKKLEKEAKQKIAVVADTKPVTPVPPVTITQSAEILDKNVNTNPLVNEGAGAIDISSTSVNAISNNIPVDSNSSVEVKTPVVVFDDPNQKQG